MSEEQINLLNINQTPTNETICIICHEDMYEVTDSKNINEEQCIMLPECGHCFHTNCIIAWFRTAQSNGKCPLCSSYGINNKKTHESYNNRAAFNLIERNIKRNEIPDWLKKEYEKYLLIKGKYNTISEQITNFNDLNQDITYIEGNKLLGILRRKKWDFWQKLHKKEKEIACVPVVPLILPRRKNIIIK